MVRILVPTLALIVTAGSLVLPAQRFTPAEGSDPLHVAFDQLLDPNVRDGLVYYRAMKSERARLDRYVAALNVPAATYGGWTKDQQIAFWLNAYNAFVLESMPPVWNPAHPGMSWPCCRCSRHPAVEYTFEWATNVGCK